MSARCETGDDLIIIVLLYNYLIFLARLETEYTCNT